MYNNNAYQKYQSNSVYTATPAELTLMLYNGAIKFCNLAIEAIEKKDMSKANMNIVKAQNIIVELQATLNEKYPIAKELDQYYDFIKRQLIQANVTKNPQKITDALDIIRELRNIWQEATKVSKMG